MSSLTKFEFDRNTVREDGLVNITALANSYKSGWHSETVGMKPTTSLTRDWLVTPEAQASIAYLASTVVGHDSDLVKVVKGGNASGTWVHADLAEIFAQWLSVEYRFAVVQLIRTAKESKPEPQPKPQLPIARSIIEYIQAFESCGLMEDPMIRSLVTQRACEELSTVTPALNSPEQPLNVTSIASNLGFSQQAIGNGSALGKFVIGRHTPLGTSQHGKYKVNVYLPSEVESTIGLFFNTTSAIA